MVGGPPATRRRGLWPAVMAPGLRFEQRWIEADGVSTRCLEAGAADAPPVVFLHGVGGHLEAFQRNLAAHAERFRVIAYDLPGHGLSSFVPDRSYEIDGYVRHLEAVLDRLGIGSAVLSGLSLGGWTAARFAAAWPSRVDALILNATGGATGCDERVMADIRRLSSAAMRDPRRGRCHRPPPLADGGSSLRGRRPGRSPPADLRAAAHGCGDGPHPVPPGSGDPSAGT